MDFRSNVQGKVILQCCVMSPWLFNVFMDGVVRGEC